MHLIGGTNRAIAAAMKPRFLLFALLFSCVPQVIVSDENEIDSESTTSSSGGSGQGGAVVSGPAVAMTRAQLDVLWNEYWEEHTSSSVSTTTTGGGSDLDPNDLFIQIADVGASCNSPSVELDCGGHWNVSIGIPPALQYPGVYDLEDPALSLYSFMSETGQPHSPAPDDCSWGGGSLGPGTLEIVSISESEIHFKLTLLPFIWESDPSGEYTAPRCPVTE